MSAEMQEINKTKLLSQKKYFFLNERLVTDIINKNK